MTSDSVPLGAIKAEEGAVQGFDEASGILCTPERDGTAPKGIISTQGTAEETDEQQIRGDGILEKPDNKGGDIEEPKPDEQKGDDVEEPVLSTPEREAKENKDEKEETDLIDDYLHQQENLDLQSLQFKETDDGETDVDNPSI